MVDITSTIYSGKLILPASGGEVLSTCIYPNGSECKTGIVVKKPDLYFVALFDARAGTINYEQNDTGSKGWCVSCSIGTDSRENFRTMIVGGYDTANN